MHIAILSKKMCKDLKKAFLKFSLKNDRQTKETYKYKTVYSEFTLFASKVNEATHICFSSSTKTVDSH